MKSTDQATGRPGPIEPLIQAKTKTEQIKDELAIAGAELHLSSTALGQNLPEDQKKGDVRKALEQNAVIEEKVLGAAEELHDVKELLEEEIAQRHRLERELERRSPS
ncbi:hypothetical protein [Caenimonas soli]|uniref:hypothetical protein n=1 Tax=Caenimonas soli TaxID=2735555 RepID=UPI001553F1BA|nr:hypothetical protein [Caenimonas soli]NPC58705.1 hypothetical protein [Caenimonas soli]